MKQDLEQLRQRIRELDIELLTIIAQRMTCAAQIGRIKDERNLPIQDDGVERQVFANVHDAALNLGLETDFAHDLASLLVRHATRKQKQDKTARQSCQSLANQGGTQVQRNDEGQNL